MRFQKGDIVLVSASVYIKDAVPAQWNYSNIASEKQIHIPEKLSLNSDSVYVLTRIEYGKSIKGIVVGWSTRRTGHYFAPQKPSGFYGSEYEPGYLDFDKTHKVIMIQPTETQQWNRPFPCLEEDLELVND